MTDPGYVEPQYHLMASADVQALRDKTLKALDLQPGSALHRFTVDVFADHEVVQSYYNERSFQVPGRGLNKVSVPLVPMVQAMQSARWASQSDGVRPEEREFALVAALVYPCGVLHITHPLFKCKAVNWHANRPEARRMAAQLLEVPLANLRRADAAMGQIMAAVLNVHTGTEMPEACNAEQVARIGTAVYLANMRLTVLALGLSRGCGRG